jgi:branched-chain amino acid transport system permease protein
MTIPDSTRRYIPIAALVLMIVLVQTLTAVFGTAYYLTQLTMTAYYVLLSLGLCMVMGYAGQISLGQAGFFAIGGYTAATLTTVNLIDRAGEPLTVFLSKAGLLISGETLYGDPLLYLSPWISFLAAVALAAVTAWLLGVPVLRLRGHYLAMATLGFGIVIYRIVLGTPLFGEADGITSVPGFTIIPGITVSGDFKSRAENYYIAWGLVVVGMLLLKNLIDSRVGRALRSLHGGEDASEAMGVDTSRYKVTVFVIGAVFAAVAGVMMTHYNGGIGPSEAGVHKSVRYVAIVAIGGMANLWGALIMGLVLNFLSLRGIFGSYDDAVFGLILVGIMIFAPDGFFRKAFLNELQEVPMRIVGGFRRLSGGGPWGGRNG